MYMTLPQPCWFLTGATLWIMSQCHQTESPARTSGMPLRACRSRECHLGLAGIEGQRRAEALQRAPRVGGISLQALEPSQRQVEVRGGRPDRQRPRELLFVRGFRFQTGDAPPLGKRTGRKEGVEEEYAAKDAGVVGESQFSQDLERWVAGLRELLSSLEKVLGMTGNLAEKRQSAKRGLPEIAAPPAPNYSICQLSRIVGKTVARVEFGFRKAHSCLHQSEAMILHFTDGSSLGVYTGSNVGNLTHDHEGFEPGDFHVDFILQWVPSPSGDPNKPGE